MPTGTSLGCLSCFLSPAKSCRVYVSFLSFICFTRRFLAFNTIVLASYLHIFFFIIFLFLRSRIHEGGEHTTTNNCNRNYKSKRSFPVIIVALFP